MPIIPLNASQHRTLRVAPSPDLSYAAGLNHAVIGFDEVALAAADYPLVLMKDGHNGQFHLTALLGFAPGRNLFVMNGHWHATYMPVTVLRYPFLLDESSPVGLAIDDASTLVGNHGDALFDDRGAPSPRVRAVARQLEALRQGRAAMQAFAADAVAQQLVRPIALELTFDNGPSSQIDGLFSISEAALAELDGATLHALNARGYLAPLFVMLASLSQFYRLQQLHNVQANPAIVDLRYAVR